MPGLTESQLRGLEITERVASCFSLVGTLFVFCTFLSSPNFRRPINRLVFYASWGNMLSNIATLISESGIRAGANSHLCQFQGFLIQMFVPADAFWNLAMAVNVYLTLFRKYNAQQLKALEWKYLALCYGIPFIIALVPLFIKTEARGHIYGPAVLWCWISSKWEPLRIAILYGPAWIAIVCALGIYIVSGREIFQKRQELRAFQSDRGHHHMEPESDSWSSYKTTQIAITSEAHDSRRPTIMMKDKNGVTMHEKPLPPGPIERTESAGSRNMSSPSKTYDQYSISIAARGLKDARRPSMPERASTGQTKKHRAALEANRAAWAYCKVALLFFVSLLVTWVPSSANRVFALAHGAQTSVPLAFASGLVLSLMGFWNSLIYITTSRAACRELFRSIADKCGMRPAIAICESSTRKGASFVPGGGRKGSAVGEGRRHSWADDFRRIEEREEHEEHV